MTTSLQACTSPAMLLSTVVGAISTCRSLAVLMQATQCSCKFHVKSPRNNKLIGTTLKSAATRHEENRVAWLAVCGKCLCVGVRVCGGRLAQPSGGSEPSHSAELWLGTSAPSARVSSVPLWSFSAVGSFATACIVQNSR